MKVLVDENIPLLTVDALLHQGHDVLDIRGTGAQGITDRDLWEMAQNQRRLLITTDKGFAEHRDDLHFGVLIIRLRQPSRAKIHDRVMRAMAQFSESEWPGLLVVMRDAVQSAWRARSDPISDTEAS